MGPNTCIIWHCSFGKKSSNNNNNSNKCSKPFWWCDDRLTRDVRLITALYRAHIQMLCDSIHVTRHMLNVVSGLLIISLQNYGWCAFFIDYDKRWIEDNVSIHIWSLELFFEARPQNVSVSVSVSVCLSHMSAIYFTIFV